MILEPPATIRRRPRGSPHRLRHCRQFLVNEVEGLERANHRFELDDLTVAVPRDEIDAVDEECMRALIPRRS